MNIVVYIMPILILLLILYSLIKKKNVYELFILGTKESLPLIFSLFPYLVAILVMNELMIASGLIDVITILLTPIFNLLGIPNELIKLIILKPFTGSGSFAILNEILIKNGVNNYISLVACSLFGSSETVFYISAVYYAKCKNKKATKAIILSLVACFISTIFTCLICRFFV